VTYGRLGTWQPGAPLPRWRQQDAVDAGALPWDQVADHFARPASEGRALTGRLSVARKKKVLRHRACLLIGPAPWSSCLFSRRVEAVAANAYPVMLTNWRS
jgi:hypothetical protein